MTSEPRDVTLGEVVRRLDDVVRQLSALTAKLDETYLRKDVFEVRMAAIAENYKDLRSDLDADREQTRQNRRLALSGIILPVLATIIAALLLSVLLPR